MSSTIVHIQAAEALLPVYQKTMITIRAATSRDRNTVRRIECACFGFERLFFGLWPQVGGKGTSVWIAESAGKPAGYLIAYLRGLKGNMVMYVGGVGVLPVNRKQGIGSRLMDAVLTACPAIWLHVRASNVAATKLYLKLGMHVSQRIPKFYSNGDDALVMQTSDVAVD